MLSCLRRPRMQWHNLHFIPPLHHLRHSFGSILRVAVGVGCTFLPVESLMSKKDTFRVVTRASDGSFRIRDFPSAEPIHELHSQIGVDDSSADLALRGLPVFRGLVGPIPEGKNVVRYESPEVFEAVTKEWSNAKVKRRRRRRPEMEAAQQAES